MHYLKKIEAILSDKFFMNVSFTRNTFMYILKDEDPEGIFTLVPNEKNDGISVSNHDIYTGTSRFFPEEVLKFSSNKHLIIYCIENLLNEFKELSLSTPEEEDPEIKDQNIKVLKYAETLLLKFSITPSKIEEKDINEVYQYCKNLCSAQANAIATMNSSLKPVRKTFAKINTDIDVAALVKIFRDFCTISDLSETDSKTLVRATHGKKPIWHFKSKQHFIDFIEANFTVNDKDLDKDTIRKNLSEINRGKSYTVNLTVTKN